MCFRRLHGANTKDEEWAGPARIIGFEKKAVWLVYAGIPVLLIHQQYSSDEQREDVCLSGTPGRHEAVRW